MKRAIIVAAGYTCVTTDANLSTMRVGPRKLVQQGDGFEFGRPVDFRDKESA